MKSGWVTFAGAGPGAVDLLTIRCRDAIAEAETIVYAGSLVNPDVLQFAPAFCGKYDSAGMTLPEIVELMIAAARAKRKVLRLHTGDPSLYGAIAEQMAALNKAGIPYEVIPGVTAACAAAAAVKAELTMPGVSQAVVLIRRVGRTPVPEGQDLRGMASHGATMAIYLSVADIEGVVDDLILGGYTDNTPVSVVYRATWQDEKIISGTLSSIAAKVRKADIARQAVILVGESLQRQGEASKLYAPEFSHGYRTGGVAALQSGFPGRVAVYALTEHGSRLALKIGEMLPGATVFLSKKHWDATRCGPRGVKLFEPRFLDRQVAENRRTFEGHIFVMAAGIVVRKIAPLLEDKTRDPAVVVCDEAAEFAVSLIGGHIAGANRLARDAAKIIGGRAVITTATDAQGLIAFDDLAARQGWEIVNPSCIKQLNNLLLERRQIGMIGPERIVRDTYSNHHHIEWIPEPDSLPERLEGLVVLDNESPETPGPIPALYLRSIPLVAGVGCRRGTSAEEILEAVDVVLDSYGLDCGRVRDVVSITLKKDEPGLLEAAMERGWNLEFFSSGELAGIPVPSPSHHVELMTGTPSVAEAAALIHGGGRLLIPKQKYGKVTVSVATLKSGRREIVSQASGKTGRIYAVGIGSGTAEGMTELARRAITNSEIVVGYKTYCDQIKWLIEKKRVVTSGMRKEVSRCDHAIDEALNGHAVALVSSGDAGIYGMAGLLFERLAARGIDNLDVEVIPGITAASLAAAAVGAPLMNDFAAISLSDLLTERETVLRRLKYAAESGVTCVLYNPRSRTRRELFNIALGMFRKTRGDETPAAVVSHAGCTDQKQWVGQLGKVPTDDVDMSSVVIVGSSQTFIRNGRMVTLRGYKTDSETQKG